MSLRFRRSVKIAPGVKVNMNKKSASITVGGKGVHVTKNTNGRTTTSVNLPVKGLSYTDIQTKSKKVSKRAGDAPAAPVSVSSAPSATAKVQKPKVTVIAVESPGTSIAVVGVLAIIAGFFLSGISIPVGIVVALFGIYFIYVTIQHKRNPDSGKYITEERLRYWRQLLSLSSGNVYELGKASLPVLVELKNNSLEYLQSLSSAVLHEDIEKYSSLLLDCQKKIIDFSEFVILKGDEPQKDYEKYSALVSERRA